MYLYVIVLVLSSFHPSQTNLHVRLTKTSPTTPTQNTQKTAAQLRARQAPGEAHAHHSGPGAGVVHRGAAAGDWKGGEPAQAPLEARPVGVVERVMGVVGGGWKRVCTGIK